MPKTIVVRRDGFTGTSVDNFDDECFFRVDQGTLFLSTGDRGDIRAVYAPGEWLRASVVGAFSERAEPRRPAAGPGVVKAHG